MKKEVFTDFCRISLPLLKSGYPVSRAAALVSRMGTARKETVGFARYVLHMMETGCSFTYAAQNRCPQLKRDGSAALFMVFEQTGALETAMDLYLKQEGRKNEAMKKLWGAMLYPSLVLVALMILCAYLAAESAAFGLFGGEDRIAAALAKGGLVLGLWYLLYSVWVWHTFRLDQKEQFYRLMAAGLSTGTDVLTCLRLSALTQSPLAPAVARVMKLLQEGVPLASALQHQNVFKHDDFSLLEVTGDNRNLSQVFLQYADSLENRHRSRQETVMRLTEPVLLSGVGAVIIMVSREAILPFLTSWGGVL